MDPTNQTSKKVQEPNATTHNKHLTEEKDPLGQDRWRQTQGEGEWIQGGLIDVSPRPIKKQPLINWTWQAISIYPPLPMPMDEAIHFEEFHFHLSPRRRVRWDRVGGVG